MTEIEAAVERGRSVIPKKGSKWEPATVDYPGRLVARVRNTETSAVEGVYRFRGQWLHYALGKGPDGAIKVHRITDRMLKRIAKAMLDVEGDSHDEMIREAAARRKADMPTSTPKKKRRRRSR